MESSEIYFDLEKYLYKTALHKLADDCLPLNVGLCMMIGLNGAVLNLGIKHQQHGCCKYRKKSG